jgi:Response regulator containing a CheY-like receiver domain and an HD-GYP domain
MSLFEHHDVLEPLNRNLPLEDKLVFLHDFLRRRYEFIDRVAIALYDPKTDLLKTYVHSSGGDDPLALYQARLEESASLKEIVEVGRPRVVNDLAQLARGEQAHTRRIGAQGYGASYTLPMYRNGGFFGFLFFNSYGKEVFRESVLRDLDLFGHLLALVVINEQEEVRTLVASVKTATSMAQHRDFETGAHLDRMSNYARLIARELAGKYGLSDALVEHIFLFSPLHDIGKIAIPDQILLKNGKLEPEEYEVMKTHAAKGQEIIDTMLENFGFDGMEHIDLLRNIAHYHHEAINGSGYPAGLREEEIPLEARIVAVADVFDALTSRRPYKAPWSNDDAFAFLLKMAGEKFDRECVQALVDSRSEVEEIQVRFQEDRLG